MTGGEKHTYSLEYADIDVVVSDASFVDIVFTFPAPQSAFTISASDLSDLVAFVEKHADVNVQPDRLDA